MLEALHGVLKADSRHMIESGARHRYFTAATCPAMQWSAPARVPQPGLRSLPGRCLSLPGPPCRGVPGASVAWLVPCSTGNGLQEHMSGCTLTIREHCDQCACDALTGLPCSKNCLLGRHQQRACVHLHPEPEDQRPSQLPRSHHPAPETPQHAQDQPEHVLWTCTHMLPETSTAIQMLQRTKHDCHAHVFLHEVWGLLPSDTEDTTPDRATAPAADGHGPAALARGCAPPLLAGRALWARSLPHVWLACKSAHIDQADRAPDSQSQNAAVRWVPMQHQAATCHLILQAKWAPPEGVYCWSRLITVLANCRRPPTCCCR